MARESLNSFDLSDILSGMASYLPAYGSFVIPPPVNAGAASPAPAGAGTGSPLGGVTVQNTPGLLSALAAAVAGETIRLAPGVYSAVSVQNLALSGVTVTSADPAHEAVLTGLTVTSSSGISFNNLEFSFAVAANAADQVAFGVTVKSSHDIHFSGDSFHGVLDGDPSMDIKGLGIVQSSNVSVQNSEFQQLLVGVGDVSSDHVSITGNSLHDIRRDGVDNPGSSQVTISNNAFFDFHSVGSAATGGDHSDAIQFWTTSGTGDSTDLTVTGNLMIQGQGSIFQGVFLRDDGETQPFANVIIRDNVIIGGSWNAISVDHAQGLQVVNNSVQGLAGAPQIPHIQVMGSQDVVLSGNSAPKFVQTNDIRLSETHDLSPPLASDGGASALDGWLGGHSGFLDAHAKVLASTLGALDLLPSQHATAPAFAYAPPSFTPGYAFNPYMSPYAGLAAAGYFGMSPFTL